VSTAEAPGIAEESPVLGHLVEPLRAAVCCFVFSHAPQAAWAVPALP
jgi:hypothetical protein